VWIVVSTECEYYMGHPTPVSHGRKNLMKYEGLTTTFLRFAGQNNRNPS